MIKLNVGSNAVMFEGWDNLDLYPGPPGVIQHDARTRFPYEDNSIDFIFSEHFIEHLTAEEGLFYFQECYRMLKPGGVVRTSTFCIDEIMLNCVSDEKWNIYKEKMLNGQFKHLSRVEFFNFAVYEGHAHKYMYNIHEIARILELAGFRSYCCPIKRESMYPELCNREWRDNSNCIVEAVK
jgi:predicted SAM-dependent methyltransferase